jgi:type I restriction enzyme R subunit
VTAAFPSPNFGFLEPRDTVLHRYAALAERYFADDPNGSMAKMRQFAEAITHATAAGFGNETGPEEEFFEVLRGLDYRVPARVVDLLHELRKIGNRALHAHADEHRDALTALKIGHQVAVWYHATFRVRGFKAPPFVVPPNPEDATSALLLELDTLRDEAAKVTAELSALRGTAADLERIRKESEEKAAQLYADQVAAMDLAAEAERGRQEDRARFEAELAAIRAQIQVPVAEQVLAQRADAARVAAEAIEIDEATTRALIDARLREAGWEADSMVIRYAKGERPIKGRARAIAEWPTASGPADYALFVGLTLVAVVEAKKRAVDVMSTLDQARRYARGIHIEGDIVLPGGPWGEDKVPFIFATNGRPFLQQLRTRSGIWFRDLRRPQNPSLPLVGWKTPARLMEALKVDVDAAQAALRSSRCPTSSASTRRGPSSRSRKRSRKASGPCSSPWRQAPGRHGRASVSCTG